MSWLGVFVVASLTVGAAGFFVGQSDSTGNHNTIILPTQTTEPPRPQPATALAAAPVRSCSVAQWAADPALGQFLGTVRLVQSDEVLFDRQGTTNVQIASVMKVLTAAAALNILGPEHRITTTVVQGDTPGTIVLVGGGDVTLASGSSNIYRGSASMIDLADQARTAWNANPANAGIPISRIVLDSSLFTGESWHSSWDPVERKDGTTAMVTALQVDGDRDAPASNISRRSDDPVARAGEAFRDALGVNAVVVQGTADARASLLAQVQSAPVSTMVQESLLRSDNVEAEALARLVALKMGLGGSFEAVQTAIPQALAHYGLSASDLSIVDGSGLSDQNRVSSVFVSALMQQIAQRNASLGYIFDGLPVAGQSGSLAQRFSGDSSVARGKVRAKTGWINSANTLAGVIETADGGTLVFAFFALDTRPQSARPALDALATAVYRCGKTLSNN